MCVKEADGYHIDTYYCFKQLIKRCPDLSLDVNKTLDLEGSTLQGVRLCRKVQVRLFLFTK